LKSHQGIFARDQGLAKNRTNRKLAAKRDMPICSVTNCIGSAKLNPRPEGLVLCDVGPDIQEHLDGSFDRTYPIAISDDLVTESLPHELLPTTRESSVEGLDLSYPPGQYEF
jgi:hypothetical protein